jgi:hypothetical protein
MNDINLSERIQSINNTLVEDVKNSQKAYILEQISALEKKEAIATSRDVANYRSHQAIKGVFNSILNEIGENNPMHDKLKRLFNEHL